MISIFRALFRVGDLGKFLGARVSFAQIAVAFEEEFDDRSIFSQSPAAVSRRCKASVTISHVVPIWLLCRIGITNRMVKTFEANFNDH
jgi:hypothetical protein